MCLGQISQGSLEGSPLHEAEKMETKLQPRPHNAGDTRTMGFLPRKAEVMENNQPKRERLCVLQGWGY